MNANNLTIRVDSIPDSTDPVLYLGEEYSAQVCLNQDGVVYTAVSQRNNPCTNVALRNRTFTWDIPSSIKASVLRQLLLDLRTIELFMRVYAGLEMTLNAQGQESAHLGDDAENASEELSRVFGDLFEAPEHCMHVCSCQSWCANSSIDDLWKPASTLQEAVQDLLEDAARNDVWLTNPDELPSLLQEKLLEQVEDGSRETLSDTQRFAILTDTRYAERLAAVENSDSGE